MNSSSRPILRNVPSPEGSRAGSPYTRFIPREELSGAAPWEPNSFEGTERRSAPRPDPAPNPEQAALLATVRQSGYKAGYRDGLAALEGFKHSLAQEAATHFNALAQSFDAQLQAIEAQAAQAVARTAVLLARQALRAEIDERPEHVRRLAQEAVGLIMLSARQIQVRLHPEDHNLVAEGLADGTPSARVQLVCDGTIQRGGVLVQSDVGDVDARIDARIAQAAASLGVVGSPVQTDASLASTQTP
jgi:flagellar assembly protein FliH